MVNWQNLGVCLLLVHCSRTIFWSLVSHSLTFCNLVIRTKYSAFPTTGSCFVSKGFFCFVKQVWMDGSHFSALQRYSSNGKNNLHYCLPRNKIQGKKRAKGIISCIISYNLQLHSLENKGIAGCSSVQRDGQNSHSVGAALHVRSNLSAFLCD